jgi:hypothetical protein
MVSGAATVLEVLSLDWPRHSSTVWRAIYRGVRGRCDVALPYSDIRRSAFLGEGSSEGLFCASHMALAQFNTAALLLPIVPCADTLQPNCPATNSPSTVHSTAARASPQSTTFPKRPSARERSSWEQ